jgi:aerobic carbon-monoxide dehydrogenase medium subunit
MSALKLSPFEYFEPATVGEGVALLQTYGEDAQVLAGGIDLIPRMRSGKVQAAYLVNIQRISGLDFIRSGQDGGIEFGAMCSLHSLELCTELKERFPAFYDAIHQIASAQTKYMGTAVGNLCAATPASDIAPALAACGAELTLAGPGGSRRVPVADFFAGYRRTALKRGELVTGVSVPGARAGLGVAFLNLVRTHGDIAKITVAAGIVVENGVCRDPRIFLGSAAPTMFRARGAETMLEGERLTDELLSRAAEIAATQAKPMDDLRSTAEYRKAMAAVLVGRALHKAAERSHASLAEEVAR